MIKAFITVIFSQIHSSILPIVKDKGQLSHVSLSFFFQDSEERLILTDRTVAIYIKE
jgi:hypothetical protein